MSIPKPQMRGLLASHIKKHVAVASILSIAGGAYVYFFINEERKRKYAEFYSTYDAMADWERMKDLGYFQSMQEEE